MSSSKSNPSDSLHSGSSKVFSHPSASTTPCRNILIHGYCKFADKGCAFNHDAQQQSSAPVASANFKKKLNTEAPAFNTLATFSPSNNSTTSFTSTPLTPNNQTSANPKISPSISSISPFIPKNFQSSSQLSVDSTPSTGLFTPESYQQGHSPDVQTLSTQLSQSRLDEYSPQYDMIQGSSMEYGGMPAQQDFYYQPHTVYPLQYHLYAPNSYRNLHLTPHQRIPENYFISNELREELQRKNEASLQTLGSSSLPEYVHVYHTLVPLDTTFEKSAWGFGYPSWIYKAASNRDGNLYALRRIEGFRLTNEKAMGSVAQWNKLQCPNVVKLKEAFTTKAFGDNSLVFVYDYHPMSRTMMSVYFGPEMYQQMNRVSIPEQQIWTFITQILSALRAIHRANLAAKIIEPSRILLTDTNVIRLNCCGVFDVLHYEVQRPLESYQQEDILNFGKLILSLCEMSLAAPQYLDEALDNVENNYSPQLHKFLSTILEQPTDTEVSPAEKLQTLLQLSTDKVYDSFGQMLEYNNYILGQLSTELENGRLARLLCKLGAINERPEYNNDPAWSDTGKRYPLKLFRDYVFHQTDALGTPVVDLGHMLRELNKLDAGIDEPVMLVSRDQQTFMIVTYKELKECVGSAFRELRGPPPPPSERM